MEESVYLYQQMVYAKNKFEGATVCMNIRKSFVLAGLAIMMLVGGSNLNHTETAMELAIRLGT
ncbi:hypothetical protein [Bacillus safensis]|uniref:hypothetical protein n=1 Tax=Bacillus safensis TaxID=561879 RepID=UPI003672DC85